MKWGWWKVTVSSRPRSRGPWEFENPACAGSSLEIFYEDDVDDQNSANKNKLKEVVKVCGLCSHRLECAEWGITKERWGIWGGLTPKQRENIRRSRRRADKYVFIELLP